MGQEEVPMARGVENTVSMCWHCIGVALDGQLVDSVLPGLIKYVPQHAVPLVAISLELDSTDIKQRLPFTLAALRVPGFVVLAARARHVILQPRLFEVEETWPSRVSLDHGDDRLPVPASPPDFFLDKLAVEAGSVPNRLTTGLRLWFR